MRCKLCLSPVCVFCLLTHTKTTNTKTISNAPAHMWINQKMSINRYFARQCAAVCCSVLQVCCSVWCVAVCCSAATEHLSPNPVHCGVRQCVAVCCRCVAGELQVCCRCVAGVVWCVVCCSVLQCSNSGYFAPSTPQMLFPSCCDSIINVDERERVCVCVCVCRVWCSVKNLILPSSSWYKGDKPKNMWRCKTVNHNITHHISGFLVAGRIDFFLGCFVTLSN